MESEKNMNKYIIIPGCSDLNRGDQALAWETKRLAEECGFKGEFYLTTERNEPTAQSEKKGLNIISPIHEHPSRKFKNKENIKYTKKLKVKWGIVSLMDLIGSIFVLLNPFKKLTDMLLSIEKKKTFRIFEQCDAVFMKGGGLLQTYGGISSTYSMYFWVYPIFLAHRLNKPVYVMPNSFGPFEGPFVKKIARAALKRCTILTSRETLSEECVKKDLGLPITTYPDLAFTLPKSDLKREVIYKKFNLPTDKKLVAITMRPYRFPNAVDPELAYNKFKSEMASFIEWLYSQNYMPVIVEHTLAVNAHENDGACIRDVTSMLSSEKFCVISKNSFDCYDLKCIYSYCDYIIGTRFHSMIFAFGSNIPGIAISYTGNKSQGIMHDIGLDNYVIEIDKVNAEILEEKFLDLLKNETEVVAKIDQYNDYAKKARLELGCFLKSKGINQ